MRRILLLMMLGFSLSSLFAQTNHIVQVSDFAFTPKDLTIEIGDTVTWRWVEGAHTTTSDSTSGFNIWNVPITSGNPEFSFVLKSIGLYRYYCIPHGSPGGIGMAGSIQVNDVVPVELLSFTVKLQENIFRLTWETATELNNLGFDIERRIDKSEWVKIGFNKGYGTSSTRRSYAFDDNNIVEQGKYTYRLKQQDFDGRFKYYKSKSIDFRKDWKYELLQNYPNPFNPETSIRLSVPLTSFVTVRVFNLLGQQISELFSGYLERGMHDFKFNAEEYISGIYLYKVEAKGEDGATFTDTRKMTLLK